MLNIEDQFILKNIAYAELINELRVAFMSNDVQCPSKLTFDYKSKKSTADNTMLIMPAWDNEDFFGVKLITATPSNSTTKTPYLNGMYLIFDANTGMPLVSMDAKLITNMRTAATSVLASQLLARETASSVLIIGNGAISPYYINAYASMPNIKNIYLWGRDYQKSMQVVDSISNKTIAVKAIKSFEEIITEVDIISCITSTQEPIVHSHHLQPGQHLDLAGSFTTDMREVSSDVLAQCQIYVDNRDVTPHHAGEIVHAMNEKKIKEEDIRGTLADLCKAKNTLDPSGKTCTLFKSTGMAIEDLVIGKLILEKYKEQI